MHSPPPLLSAASLHQADGPTPAPDGADFAVSAGGIVAVMGPSGSGRSTLLHCLAAYSDREIVVRDGTSRDPEHIR